MFKINQKVILYLLSTPGKKRELKKENHIQREGIIIAITDKFITVWIKALKSSNYGWNEAFLLHDIGKSVIIQDASEKRYTKTG